MTNLTGGVLPLQGVGDDYAKKPGLSIHEIAQFLRDVSYQPVWRAKADIEADYYDSNQYDAETLQDMAAKGIPPIVVNLIAPTINLILGMEARNRQDWAVKADDDSDADFARAMTKKLQESERASYADKACSDAYSAQVKTGLGWVHTRRQRLDPFRYKYACEYVHRREIWWDWFDTDPMLKQARYLIRRKWYDVDVLKSVFPKFKGMIDQLSAGWTSLDIRVEDWDVGQPMYQDWLTSRDYYGVFDLDQWRNMDRRRLALYEVWYRVWKNKDVIRFDNGNVFEFNKDNPVHQSVVNNRLAELMRNVPMPKMRLSYWIGPNRLVDVPSPMPHEDFPYVPFWGYREDRTAIPYGHIRAMRPLQDEVNARRARMLWQLSARRLVADDDAFKDKRGVEAEIARPDAAIYLNPNRKNKGAIEQSFKVYDDFALNAQQMSAYQDAADKLQDVANVFQEQLGKRGGADSGVAIAHLVEQGTTALAELNDNYHFARQQVGQQLYDLNLEDMKGREEKVSIDLGIGGGNKDFIFNQAGYDEKNNIKFRDNDTEQTRAHVIIQPVESSATFRQYQYKNLVALVKDLPSPELQAAMLDMVVMASDIPDKEQVAKRIREQLGLNNPNPEAMSDEEKKQFEAQMADQERIKALTEALEQMTVEAADLDNRLKDAEVEKTEEEVEKVKAETDKLIAETDQIEAEPVETEPTGFPGIDPNKVEVEASA